jgi:hypothetical protein
MQYYFVSKQNEQVIIEPLGRTMGEHLAFNNSPSRLVTQYMNGDENSRVSFEGYQQEQPWKLVISSKFKHVHLKNFDAQLWELTEETPTGITSIFGPSKVKKAKFLGWYVALGERVAQYDPSTIGHLDIEALCEKGEVEILEWLTTNPSLHKMDSWEIYMLAAKYYAPKVLEMFFDDLNIEARSVYAAFDVAIKSGNIPSVKWFLKKRMVIRRNRFHLALIHNSDTEIVDMLWTHNENHVDHLVLRSPVLPYEKMMEKPGLLTKLKWLHGHKCIIKRDYLQIWERVSALRDQHKDVMEWLRTLPEYEVILSKVVEQGKQKHEEVFPAILKEVQRKAKMISNRQEFIATYCGRDDNLEDSTIGTAILDKERTKLLFRTRKGHPMWFDVSHKTCSSWGFYFGERITYTKNDNSKSGWVLGVRVTTRQFLTYSNVFIA